MPAARIAPGQKGFTLAEMLIAIIIFAAVVSMVYGAYNATFKVISNADSASRYGERARVALARIAEDLESLYIGNNGVLTGESEIYGEFRGDSLRFTSTAHLVFNREEQERGYAMIGYTVEEDGDSGLLKLYRSDVPVLPGVSPEERRGFLLCDGLREVAFTYIDSDGNEQDTWSSEEKRSGGNPVLPLLLRLRLGFPGGDEEDVVAYTGAVAFSGQKKTP